MPYLNTPKFNHSMAQQLHFPSVKRGLLFGRVVPSERKQHGRVSISSGVSHLSYLHSGEVSITLTRTGFRCRQEALWNFSDTTLLLLRWYHISEKSFQPCHIALALMVPHLQEVLSAPPHCFCSDGTTHQNNNPLFTSHQELTKTHITQCPHTSMTTWLKLFISQQHD